MEKICAIYCMENLINGKKYIGQTRNLTRRIRDHTTNYKRESNPYLNSSIEKYGTENFSIYIVEHCQEEELNEREIYYIGKFNTTCREYGYNILAGGNIPPSFFGKSHSEKTKLLMAESAIGNQRWLGRHHTQETKDKKSKLARGTKHYFFGKKRENSGSKYFGVSKYNDCRSGTNKTKYRAKISVNGKVIDICQSTSELECAIRYNEFILEHKLPNPINMEINNEH